MLLAAGTAGKRYALPHARVLIHQPYTEGGGQGSDIEIQANEILRMRKEMEGIISAHTGRTPEQVAHDIEEPFGPEEDDLPLDEICAGLERSVRQALQGALD